MYRIAYIATAEALLHSLALTLAALAWSPPVHASDTAPTRPNVLLIICDDLNDWALHPRGHPVVKTPNIDRLRERCVSLPTCPRNPTRAVAANGETVILSCPC